MRGKRHLYTSFLNPNSIGKRGRGSSWVLSWLPRVVRWRIIASSKIVDTVLSASLKDIVYSSETYFKVTYLGSVVFLPSGEDT